MSKSLGNLITIKEALEKYSADAIRIFILGSHYRSPLTYSEEGLEATERGADRLRQVVHSEGKKRERTDRRATTDIYRQRFIEAMDDDFNTAQALATLFDLAREINRADEHGDNTVKARATLTELTNVLGLTLKLSEEPTLEAEVHNKAQTLEGCALKNFAEAIEPIKASLPKLDRNEAAFTSLLRDLRNEFAHSTYPSLDEAASSTQIYSDTLKSLRDQIIHSNFGGVLESLSALSSSATANIGSLSDFRDELRNQKKWQQADMIRVKLDEAGTTLEDTPKGTVRKRKR